MSEIEMGVIGGGRPAEQVHLPSENTLDANERRERDDLQPVHQHRLQIWNSTEDFEDQHFVPELQIQAQTPDASPRSESAVWFGLMQTLAQQVANLPARHGHGYPLRYMIFVIMNVLSCCAFVQFVFGIFVIATTLDLESDSNMHWHHFREGLFLLDSLLVAVAQFPGQFAVNRWSVPGALFLAFVNASHTLVFANWTWSRMYTRPDFPRHDAQAYDSGTVLLAVATLLFSNFAFLTWSYYIRVRYSFLLPDDVYNRDIHLEAISLMTGQRARAIA